MIELQSISKRYADQVILDDVSLTIQEGEIFGIIGRSGAGKSTILRCMNALESPDQGQVLIDNEDLTQLSPKALRVSLHKTAMIFQHFNLLNTKTVYDNIALPMRIQGLDNDLIEAKIHELLPLVELTDKQNAYPPQLSGGQKQRVAIARALSCSPKILLCDEATSALDPETTRSILGLLQKINQLYGLTIVLITHEMDVVKQICHRLAIMDAGKIIETTSMADIFTSPGGLARSLLYAELSPKLPVCIQRQLSSVPNDRPLLRLLFQGDATTGPFISQISRELHLDVNILLANIDRFEDLTCGVLMVQIHADNAMLQTFIERCQQANLTVEVLGYVLDSNDL